LLKEVADEETQIARDKEEQREIAYRRMEYWGNQEREQGKAGAVIPAA